MTVKTMEIHEYRLLQMLKERSIRRGMFNLEGGGTSEYYFDVAASIGSQDGARLIGEIIYHRTRDTRIEAIGGPGVGSIPISIATMLAYERRGLPMKVFWTLSEPRKNGTENLVEGCLPKGARVAIVDDVIATGVSILRVINAVRAEKCLISAIIGVIDRMEEAGKPFWEKGINRYETVFTIKDFLGD